MDPLAHKRLADNAYQRTVDLLNEDNPDKYQELIHFAHVARLHYEYSTLDKTDKELIENLKKTNELIYKVYLQVGLTDSAEFFKI